MSLHFQGIIEEIRQNPCALCRKILLLALGILYKLLLGKLLGLVTLIMTGTRSSEMYIEMGQET